jgi:hypothetical protein
MTWPAKISIGLGLSVLAVVRPASAASAVPPGWLDSHLNERSERCDLHAEYRVRSKLLLACGAAGVWILELPEGTPESPRFVGSSATPGEAIGFFEEPAGKVWVKLRTLDARPFDPERALGPINAFPDEAPLPSALPPDRDPAALEAAPAPHAAPARREHGVVVRKAGGRVLISLGSADGLVRGDRIELTTEHPPTDGALLGARLVWAVGVVIDVSEREAEVMLGLNEQAPVGATATHTPSPVTAGMVAPPRVSGVWELEVGARPFLAVEELGGGILFNASFGRRIGNLHLQALLEPIGFGDVAENDTIGVANGMVIASFDSDYFEAGLGLGAQTVNGSDLFLDPGSGLATSQLLRIGAHDGLSLLLRSNVVLFHRELAFGGMVGVLRIPIARGGYWLTLGGGGGSIGYGYGELGVRALLAGNGLAGSRFLTVSGGIGAVYRSGVCDEGFVCTDSTTYAGPMLGLTHEWRF